MNKKKLVDLFQKRSQLTAKVTVGNNTFDLSNPIGSNILDDEPQRPFKTTQHFFQCYTADETVDGLDYAVTVVSKVISSRYFAEKYAFESETIQEFNEVINIGLDGNGVPICGGYHRQEVHYQRKSNEKKIHELFPDWRDNFSSKEKKLAYKARCEVITDCITQKKLIFEGGKFLSLDDEFIGYLKEIGEFTRKSDVYYPYSIMNNKISEFDNIRGIIGAMSIVVPSSILGRVALGMGASELKVLDKVYDLVTYIVGNSGLVLPAAKYYPLRGPVKLSKTEYKRYKLEDAKRSIYVGEKDSFDKEERRAYIEKKDRANIFLNFDRERIEM